MRRKWTLTEAPRSSPKFKVLRSKYELWVGLTAGAEEVGYISLSPMGGFHLGSRCQGNVDALRRKVGNYPLMRVVEVEVQPPWLGQGWGTKLYERALKEAAPVILVPGSCTGMGTTPSAMRVWKSLALRYPSWGSGQDIVVASAGKRRLAEGNRGSHNGPYDATLELERGSR